MGMGVLHAVYVCGGCTCLVPIEVREGNGTPGAGLTDGGRESPVGSENWTQVLWKNSKNSL